MRKHFISCAGALLAALSIGFSASAQEPQVPQLPQDSAIVTGVLDNGLTYYIRHNETPRGQADFYIAQKVGSILEEDNQRGLAHFLEHMCFNGTQNFPDKMIINWLESIGVKFGENLNAYTSIDETVYNISNVPVGRTSVQDSCLLILHDWANALTLAPEEIDAERGVIHEEWRSRNVGSMRILDQVLPKIYPDNRYAYRMPIGTMEVVDNFPYQALIDYYEKWYRPDQQAIIVVGDIDPVYIENKIKEMFSPIEMPENAAERVYYPVEDNSETLYGIGSDPEMQNAVAYMFFKSDQIKVPDQMKNTQVYFIYNYIQTMVERMLNQRLEEFGKEPECKYAGAEIEFGDFLIASTKGALTMQVVSKDDNIVPAFGDAYREILRADQHGFTLGELERARQQFLSDIDRMYQSRATRENDSYSREYVRLFVEHEPAPGIEAEKEMYEQLAQMISIEMINQYFQSIVTDDNRVVLAMLPQKEGLAEPTEEEFAALIEEIDEEDLEAFQDEMREDPLIASLPAPGSVVSTRELADWGATEYTLSNGVKVVVKPTNFKANEILFQAEAIGKGTSLLDPAMAPSILFAPYTMGSYGLNDYSNSDLNKYLAGKQVDLGFIGDSYIRVLDGSTVVNDLPTFMEILYSYFTGFNLTEKEFNSLQSTYAGVLRNQESNPQVQWLKYVKSILFSAPARQQITSADIEAADRMAIVEMIRNMLSNAADFTFYFVGDINLDTFVPLMEQYIATLPADASTRVNSYESNPAFEMASGSGVSEMAIRMETPQSWVFIALTGAMPYTAKNDATLEVASHILSKRLLNKVREEMGATYSIGASARLSRMSTNNVAVQIPFPMKPEFRQETLPIIRGIIEEMTTNVTEEELRPAVEFLAKEARESMEKNEGWINGMTDEAINGVNTFLNAEEVANSITVADVQNFMRQLLDQNNYREIIVDPENMPATPAE